MNEIAVDSAEEDIQTASDGIEEALANDGVPTQL